MHEPFALELYRLFLNGWSARQLSVEYGISIDRIEMRLRVAAIYVGRHGWALDAGGAAFRGSSPPDKTRRGEI